jgi:predicted ester cyclase
VKIAASPDRISVRVVCWGEHVGPFFDLLTPTRRRVRFHVDHRLAVIGDHVVDDCIALDLRALLVQLANSGPAGAART